MLISGWFGKGFTFMLLTLHDGTTAQLQICSSERNVPLLPVDWKTISKRMMPANFVYGTNIKTQNLQLKARPKQNIRNERWGYIIKIYLKDIVVVPVQIK